MGWLETRTLEEYLCFSHKIMIYSIWKSCNRFLWNSKSLFYERNTSILRESLPLVNTVPTLFLRTRSTEIAPAGFFRRKNFGEESSAMSWVFLLWGIIHSYPSAILTDHRGSVQHLWPLSSYFLLATAQQKSAQNFDSAALRISINLHRLLT